MKLHGRCKHQFHKLTSRCFTLSLRTASEQQYDFESALKSADSLQPLFKAISLQNASAQAKCAVTNSKPACEPQNEYSGTTQLTFHARASGPSVAASDLEQIAKPKLCWLRWHNPRFNQPPVQSTALLQRTHCGGLPGEEELMLSEFASPACCKPRSESGPKPRPESVFAGTIRESQLAPGKKVK
jgi:hypothetical protein